MTWIDEKTTEREAAVKNVADAGWQPFGSIPPMPIAEAIEHVAGYVKWAQLDHLNWRIVNIDTGEEIHDAIL